MGEIRVKVKLRSMDKRQSSEADFFVDSRSMNSMAPATWLTEAGFKPDGMMNVESGGELVECPLAVAIIEFMGEFTAGRVIFGPDDAEPLLGVTALESTGMVVDPRNERLKRLPAVSLKLIRRTKSV